MKIDKKLIKELVEHLDEFKLTELEYQDGEKKIKVSIFLFKIYCYTKKGYYLTISFCQNE